MRPEVSDAGFLTVHASGWKPGYVRGLGHAGWALSVQELSGGRDRLWAGLPAASKSLCRVARASRISCACFLASRTARAASVSLSSPDCFCNASMAAAANIVDVPEASGDACRLGAEEAAETADPESVTSGRRPETTFSAVGRMAPVAMIVISILKSDR